MPETSSLRVLSALSTSAAEASIYIPADINCSAVREFIQREILTVHAADYEKDAHFEIKEKGGKVTITYGGCEIPGFVMKKSGTDTYILEPEKIPKS